MLRSFAAPVSMPELHDEAQILISSAMQQLREWVMNGSADTQERALKMMMPILKDQMQKGDEMSEAYIQMKEEFSDLMADVRAYLMPTVEDVPTDE